KPFSEEDALLLQALMPHLQRAVQLHQRIMRLETEKKAATDALDRWPMGVILLDANGSILLMNLSAHAIVNEKDGLNVDGGGLRAERTNETNALRQLIRGAIQTTSGNGLHSGGALALPRPSFKRPPTILVTPHCANETLFPET